MQQMIEEAQRMLLARRAALLRRSVWGSRQSHLKVGAELSHQKANAKNQSPSPAEVARPADLHLAELENQELEEIDAALRRISQGLFGRCDECGSSIGRLRLRALPETRFCVRCATAGRRRAAELQEQKQKLPETPEN